MAVYKIFPEKSATIYSFYPTVNTGLDEILEISTYYSVNGTNEVSRALLKFPSDQINSIISNTSGSNLDAYLKLSLANASSLPVNYTLYCNPLAIDWDKGTGRLSDYPNPSDGVDWSYAKQSTNIAWPTLPYATSSYGTNPGGGTWLTASNYQSTQSFAFSTSKDIEMSVTNTVLGWYSGSVENNGFILKHSSSLEFTTASKFELKYFSDNTHTIYPPCLEIRWDDSSYNTGSLSVITDNNFVTSLGNNGNEYNQNSVQRFRLNVRDRYPARVFQTTGLQFTHKALPSSSYWSIKDLDTEEIIVDYDTNYTKISCDSSGSYFDIYMNGLEPERYYKLLFKIVLGPQNIVIDEKYYFKVVR